MIYERIKKTHDRLLGRYGQGTVEIGRYTETPGATEFDPPTYSTEWETVQGIARGVDPALADGTMIQVTDISVQIAVPDTVPTVEDVVRVDGVELSIMKIERIPSAGEAVAFVLVARRG